MPNRLYTIIAILVFAFGTNANGYAQSPIDNYKYIIVPKQFGFLKEENQYRVNSTTKYLFDQNGFTTVMKGDKYPSDLQKDPCMAVTVDIVDESSVFMTKLFIVLLDCHDQEVFRSVMGKSREKSYDKTYIYALNNAFVSFENMSYSYKPESNEQEPVAAVAATTSKNVDSGTITESQPVSQSASEPVSQTSTQPAASDPVPSTNTDAGTTAAAAGAGVAAGTVAAKESSAKESSVEEVSAVEESAVEESATEEVSTAMATAPIEEESPVTVASSYGNENVAFLLIQQGDKLVAYVSDDRNPTYKKGEMIGTLVKTSLPNVFRASWKHMDKDIDLTTAYFDDQGNLKIDVERGDKIEVLTFKKE